MSLTWHEEVEISTVDVPPTQPPFDGTMASVTIRDLGCPRLHSLGAIARQAKENRSAKLDASSTIIQADSPVQLLPYEAGKAPFQRKQARWTHLARGFPWFSRLPDCGPRWLWFATLCHAQWRWKQTASTRMQSCQGGALFGRLLGGGAPEGREARVAVTGSSCSRPMLSLCRTLSHSRGRVASTNFTSSKVTRPTQSTRPWTGSIALFSTGGDSGAFTDAKAVLLKAGFDPASFREQQIAWGDQDPFQHVNNVRYARFFESARIQWMMSLGEEWGGRAQAENMIRAKGVSLILKSMEIQFRRPVTYPDTLLIGYAPLPLPVEDDTSFQVTGSAYSLAQKKFVAHSKETLVWYNYDELRKCSPPKEVQSILASRVRPIDSK